MAATGAQSSSKLGDSPFERELLRFVDALQLPELEAHYTKQRIRKHDFSAARAALVLSGGPHVGALRGHQHLRALLDAETFPERFVGAPLVAQACSFGSVMSPADRPWLTAELLPALSAGRSLDTAGARRPLGRGALRVPWPHAEDVRGSLQGWHAGWDLCLSDSARGEGLAVGLHVQLRVGTRQRTTAHPALACCRQPAAHAG